MQTVLAIAAIALPLATIHLTIAWRDWPPEKLEFDSQTLRALYNLLGWLVLAMALIYAITLIGAPIPLTATAALWAGMAFVRRRASLQKLYRFALPCALLGFICVFALFQDVFGDRNFGLINIFPER